MAGKKENVMFMILLKLSKRIFKKRLELIFGEVYNSGEKIISRTQC